MNYQSWNIEYKKFLELIKFKIDFIKGKEKQIDLNKSDFKNAELIKRINQETEFINNLIAFLLQTEIALKELEISNRHLSTQNQIYSMRHDAIEKEYGIEFEKKVRDGLSIGA